MKEQHPSTIWRTQHSAAPYQFIFINERNTSKRLDKRWKTHYNVTHPSECLLFFLSTRWNSRIPALQSMIMYIGDGDFLSVHAVCVSVCFHVSVIARPIVLAVNTICLSPLNEENSQPREPKCLSNRRADQGTYVCFADPGGIQLFPYTQSILIQASL